MSSRSVLLAVFAAALALSSGVEAQESGPSITVSIDQARILKIEDAAATIVVGNPAIVDVAIHDSKTLILTGRSFGVTNIVVLDTAGEPVLDEMVAVNNVELSSVRVYRQAQRSTYSCSPNCEPSVTIGDAPSGFEAAIGQFAAREARARAD